MKKSLLIPLIFLLITPSVFSKTKSNTKENSSNHLKNSFIFSQQFDYNFITDIGNESFQSKSIVQYSSEQMQIKTGLSAISDKVDYSLSVSYLFSIYPRFSFGPLVKYHFEEYKEDIFEHDFVVGMNIKYKINEKWYLDAYCGFLNETSIIQTTELIKMNENSMQFGIKFSYFLPQGIKLYYNLESCDFFEYPIFFSPYMTFGASGFIYKNIGFGCDYFLKWADVVTFPDGPSKTGIKIKWLLKL